MLQSVSKNFGAKFLNDHIEKIVLEIFSNPAYHRYSNGSKEQPYHAVKKLCFYNYFYNAILIDLRYSFNNRGFCKKEIMPVRKMRIGMISSQVDQLAQNNRINK